MNDVKIKTLFHCHYAVWKSIKLLAYFGQNIKNSPTGEKNYSNLKNKLHKKTAIVVVGNTQIAGYLLVMQSLTKLFPGLDVVMVGDNMSIYQV